MAFSDYSATPSSNTTIAGLAITENNTALATLNNAIRQLMADGKSLSDAVAALGTGMPVTGGAFTTNNITRSGFGGYYYANNSAFTNPRIYVLADGSPAPSSPPDGSVVYYYAA